MALSPNYGWAEPDNSSLVKNGAQDIRALGDAIDTSVWNVGYGQAGKNKLINGDFGIWQRGTSFSNPANLAYCADRFKVSYNGSGSTFTVSQETFTPGTAPVAGYEGTYFLRQNVTVAGSGETVRQIRQSIENVRTFAGQTVTLSFWAKADSARTVSPELTQIFGSGGSPAVGIAVSSVSVTTAWTRFEKVITIPSVSGKTIGTSSFLDVRLGVPINTTMTIDFWGIQLEAGSIATPFQTATGTIQGELAACQRYYWRSSTNTNINTGFAIASSTTAGFSLVQVPVTMRVSPTSVDYAGTPAFYDGVNVANIGTIALATSGNQTNDVVQLNCTGLTGLTQFRTYFLKGNGSGTYIGLSAEL
jgi:hypothetical protein